MREAVTPLRRRGGVEADDVRRAAPCVHRAREQPRLQHLGRDAERLRRLREARRARRRERRLAVGGGVGVEGDVAEREHAREQPPGVTRLLRRRAEREQRRGDLRKLGREALLLLLLRRRRRLRRLGRRWRRLRPLGAEEGKIVRRGGVAQQRGQRLPLCAVGLGRRRRDELVEDVEGALAGRVVCDAPLLEQIRDDRALVERALARARRPDLHQLAEARRVVVAHRLGAAEGLEHRVGREHRRRQLARLVARVVREVLDNRAARLGLARAALTAHHDRLVLALRDDHPTRAVGDSVHVRRQHAERLAPVGVARRLVVETRHALVRIERVQHRPRVRVDLRARQRLGATEGGPGWTQRGARGEW